MTNEMASLLEVTGLGVFIYYLFRSLSAKIGGLESVIGAQKQTIEAMDKRIEETEKIGGIYRNLISNLPGDIDNYKTIISKTKDDVILELKNQKEDTERKLAEAKRQIESSGNGQEQIKLSLSILKNLLSGDGDSKFSKRDLEIKGISEFNGRLIQDSVMKIIKSKTLVEFLEEIGFHVEVTEDDSIFKYIFSEERVMPTGEYVEAAIANHSRNGGWHIIANDNIWLNSVRLNELKDEFSSVKTVDT